MLGWLFLPYKRTGVSFTSRFMRWHGERFLGRPEGLGLRGTLQDVLDSYYYLAVDRPVQEHKHDFKTWQIDQQHAEEARLVSKAEIPKATFLAVAAVSVVCALASAPFADWKGSPIGQGASLLGKVDVKRGVRALISSKAAPQNENLSAPMLTADRASPQAEEGTDPKVKEDCENKFKTGRYTNSDISVCSSVWNELATKGGQ
ncbi:hypothetical protein VDS28_18850 [Xanthomonas campestris pv. campestris]|nr:hypothetical protein [Xanthomonas campestris pv. campestris]